MADSAQERDGRPISLNKRFGRGALSPAMGISEELTTKKPFLLPCKVAPLVLGGGGRTDGYGRGRRDSRG